MAYDVTTDVGKARLLCADLDEANELLTDAQYQALLDLEGGSIKLAAAQALDAIASSEVLVSKVIKSQDLSTDGPAVAKALREHAKTLRSQVADDVADADEGYFEIVDFDPYPSPVELDY